MVDIRTYLVLETALLKKLRTSLRPYISAYHATVSAAIATGDLTAAMDAARQLDLTQYGADNREFIKYLMLAFANFGSHRVGGAGLSQADYEPVITKVTETFLLAIERDLTLAYVNSALQSIAAGEKAKHVLVKKLDPSEYVKNFTSFAKDGDSMLQLIASQHSSRLSTWGFVAMAEVLGVTSYRITAVLDGRTSEFCRFIDGKIFKVENARSTVNLVLGLDNPADVAAVQPWPNQSKASMDKFAEMSDQDLMNQNLHIPPYHPRCRTLLKLATETDTADAGNTAGRGDAPMMPTQSDAESFSGMGVDLSPEQINHWNRFVGVNPVEAYSAVSGIDQEELVMNTPSKQAIAVQASGNILFNLFAPPAAAGYIYDPYASKLYLSYLKATGMAAEAAADYVKTSLYGALDLANSTNIQSLEVAAGDGASIAAYTAAGFAVSPAAWFKFKEKALQTLEGLNVGEDRQLIADILSSKNEEGLFALSSLDIEVDGVPLLDALLDGETIDLSLDTTDTDKMALAKEVLA